MKIACIGTGWAARERHLPALALDPRAEVIGVVGIQDDAARGLAATRGLPHWSSSLDAGWLDEVEAVTIAVPPLEHAAVIEAAIGRGWHVLSEKPLVVPAGPGHALVEAAETAGTTLAVVHNFQFAHSGRRLFGMVERGELGAIEAVHGFQLSNPRRRLPTWVPELPGGLFTDESPHLLYLIRRLLGGRLEPRAVDARLDGNEVRDLVATFEHESTWATLSMDFNASLSEWQLLVVGSERVAAFDVFRDILVVLPNDGGHRGREILRTSGAVVTRHLIGTAVSGARLVRKRLLYGNEIVVRQFLDACSGSPDAIRWMAGADGVAVAGCIEDLLGRAGVRL